ncbi:hypothetical protein [Aquipuribacter sp. MA13-6]|uniref:hypothetical protein n=1 Tax=unclassified Aquipuribacter TaxID=2635084 RepID=UPI003EE881DB
MSETERDRAPGAPGVLDAVRDGWHALGGGDAAACPGCPVCRLSESAGRMDPETAAHLQQAVGHVVSAGRELLAALTQPGRPAPRSGDPSAAGTTGAPTRSTSGVPGAADDRLADPPATSVPPRTRIPVHTPPTSPSRGDEEQE